MFDSRLLVDDLFFVHPRQSDCLICTSDMWANKTTMGSNDKPIWTTHSDEPRKGSRATIAISSISAVVMRDSVTSNFTHTKLLIYEHIFSEKHGKRFGNKFRHSVYVSCAIQSAIPYIHRAFHTSYQLLPGKLRTSWKTFRYSVKSVFHHRVLILHILGGPRLQQVSLRTSSFLHVVAHSYICHSSGVVSLYRKKAFRANQYIVLSSDEIQFIVVFLYKWSFNKQHASIKRL